MKKMFLLLLMGLLAFSAFAQDSIPVKLTESQQRQFERQMRRDSIRAHKKVWMSILGGPSYTPEASAGIGGAMLMTFKLNKNDSISQRSFLPFGFNVSINGTFVVAGAGALFFNENKFRIYTRYGYRNEPTNFFGVGFKQIDANYQSDSTTKFHKENFQLFPRFVWEIKPHFYVGGLFDINYNRSYKINEWMKEDAYYQKFGNKYMDVGIGGMVQYDTRDDVATPFTGLFVSGMATAYSKAFGSKNNFGMFELEYRQFEQVFNRRSTLAWTAKSQMSVGDVPYTSLPMFGSPNDLRGFIWGKYRDKTMAYAIVEYRHMFGSQEDYDRGAFWSKFGAVAWVGTGTLGTKPIVDWNTYKYNYGVGLRIQLQPRKNFRFDIGKGQGEKWLFYMNMTEAF
ncbi:MAG: BamA/TamA family outer membrane protein [Marinifilaceae bacterium]